VKRFALAAALMLALPLMGVPVVFAGSYSAEGAAAQVGTLATTNCLDRLNGHSYSCHGKSSIGGDFTDTFSFSGGVLTVGAISFGSTCSCGTDGSFIHPQFNHSKTKWQCVGTDGSFVISFQGTVGASGVLSKVTAASNNNGTFTFSCTGP